MHDLKVGVVGFGRIGQVHAETWGATSGVNLVAACDPCAQARERAAAIGLRAYAVPSEMLRNEELDLATICTPPASHVPLAEAFLRRNIHVLCEKPLAIGFDSALRLIEEARPLRAMLFLATKFRHVPDIQRAREMIQAGEIGDPLLFEIEFSSVVDMSQRWNSDPTISGGGVIIDNGCHALDLASYLFGAVRSVQATRLPPVQPLDAEDSALLLVSTIQGVMGHITLSWSMNSRRGIYLTVRGSKGSIEIGWRESFFYPVNSGAPSPVRIGDGYDKRAAHCRMAEVCREAVGGRCPSWISLDDCLATAAALEAAYSSLGSGQWVDIPSDTVAGAGTISRQCAAS